MAITRMRLLDGQRGRPSEDAIEIWEGRIGKLDSAYGETLSSKMKMAVPCAMFTRDLREKVLDKCAEGWDKAKEQKAALIFCRVKEEVKNVAKSRMIIPKPMDTDTIKKDHWTDEYTYDHDENHDTEENDNVCLVGRNNKGKGNEKGACFSCGMFGHGVRECSIKGAGKGKKGKRKWWQPSVTPTRAWFGCGSTSHFLRDCPSENSQHVREVVADEGPEVFFHRAHGHTGHHVRGRQGRDQARRESAVPAASWPWREESGNDTSTRKSFQGLGGGARRQRGDPRDPDCDQGGKVGRLGHRRHYGRLYG